MHQRTFGLTTPLDLDTLPMQRSQFEKKKAFFFVFLFFYFLEKKKCARLYYN